MAIDHDGLFKELLTTFFNEFLQLFTPKVLEYGDVSSIMLVETETFLIRMKSANAGLTSSSE